MSQPAQQIGQDRGAWLDARRGRITASMVPAILDKSPWMTPHDAWMAIVHDEQPEDNDAMWLGREIEDIAAQRYCQETGRRVRRWPNMLAIHPEHNFLAASPDRQVLGERRILEIKTSGLMSGYVDSSEWGYPGTDDVPDHVLVQAVFQAAVTGYPVVDVAALIAGRGFLLYEIRPSNRLITAVIENCVQFYKDWIEPSIEPPLDYRRVSSTDMVKRHPDHDETLIEADDRVLSLAQQYDEINQKYSELKAERDALQNAIKDLIADNAGIQWEGKPLFTWKQSGKGRVSKSKAFDWLAEGADPHAMKQLLDATRSSPPRVFRDHLDK